MSTVKVAPVANKTASAITMPPVLLSPPGLVGEIAAYAESCMLRKQPIFAVAAALSSMSLITKGKYLVEALQTPLGIYQILIGSSTAGKESPRSTVINVAKVVDMLSNAFDTIASGPALIAALSKLAHGEDDEKGNPTLMLLLDEMGMHISQAKGSTHGESLSSDLMKLFGKGNGVHTGKAYAGDRKDIAPIKKPFVNVLATTTQDTLVDGLSHKDVISGFLNRFMLVTAEYDCPSMAMRIQKAEVPPALVAKLKKISAIGDTTGTIEVEYAPGVEQLFEGFSNEADGLSKTDVVGGLLGRAFQNAIAVAGLLAVGDGDAHHPVITIDHAEWAIEWVKWCVNSAAEMVKNDIAENAGDKERKQVLSLIRNCSDPKYVNANMAKNFRNELASKRAPRAWLIKKAKMSSRELGDVLETLIDGESIADGELNDRTVYWAL